MKFRKIIMEKIKTLKQMSTNDISRAIKDKFGGNVAIQYAGYPSKPTVFSPRYFSDSDSKIYEIARIEDDGSVSIEYPIVNINNWAYLISAIKVREVCESNGIDYKENYRISDECSIDHEVISKDAKNVWLKGFSMDLDRLNDLENRLKIM
jgi:hypothetical protein